MRTTKAIGLMFWAICVSMVVVLFFKVIEALFGWPVALVTVLVIAGGLCWSLVGEQK